MTYRLESLPAAVKVAQSLNATAPDGVMFKARRYPDSDSRGFMRVTWGVIRLERVPDSLRRVWPDGYKPAGFVWFGV